MGKLRQSTAKIQELLDKVEQGEGGKGLQYVIERTVYPTKVTTDWVEPEQTLEFVITEEQKEYNKETVRMLWDEEIKPIVVYSGCLLNGVYGGRDVVTGESHATFSTLVKFEGVLSSVIVNIYDNGNAEAVLKKEHSDVSEIVKEMINNEEVYAAAVTDLNSRVLTINSSLDAEISHRVELAQDIHELEVIVAENEEVVANSYNDLNARIESNYQHGEETYATKQELLEEVTAITNSIVENEEVIAATLNDIMAQIRALITRIEQLENA